MALRKATQQEIESVIKGQQPVSRFSPEQKKDKSLEKTSDVLGAVFGGQTIGKSIGTNIVKSNVRSGRLPGVVEADYSKLSPEAIARLESKGVPTSAKAQREETAKTITGPTGKELAGDIIASGLGLVGFKGVPALAKGASLATKASRLGKIASIGAGIGAGRALENDGNIVEGALKGGAVSAAFPLAGGILKGTGKIAGRLGKGIAGAITGRKTQIIDEIINNPKQALIGLRSASDNLLTKNSTLIRQRIAEKARQASDEFGKALEELPKKLGRPTQLKGQKISIKVGGKTKQLTKIGIKQELTKSLRKFGVEVNPRQLKLDFNSSPFDTNESKRLNEVFNVVNNWKDTTPKGLHTLSRKIRNYRKAGEQSPELNSVIDQLSKGVHDYLGKKVPQAQEMLNKFRKAQDVIDAFDQEFATKGKLIGGTSERIKTGKKLASIFSGEKIEAQKLLRKYIPDVIPQEAGRQLVTAEAGIGAGSPGVVRNEFIRTITSSLITPKQIGEILVKVGQSKQQADKIANVLSQLSPSARIALVRLISGL